MSTFGGQFLSNAPGQLDRGFGKVTFVGNASGYAADGSLTGDVYDLPITNLFGSDGALRDSSSLSQNDLGTLLFVKRGSSYTVSTADHASLTASRKRIYIRGEGDETERPTITFSAAAATWLLDTDSVVLDNFNIRLEPGSGTVNVAAPFTISGNGCGFRNCRFYAGTDANNKVTVGLTFTGDNCFMENCDLHAATAAGATTFVRLTGADYFRMRDTTIDGATTSTSVGSLQFLTTASTFVRFDRCFIANRVAASTVAISGLASCSGWMNNVHAHVLGNAAGDLNTAFTTKASIQCGPSCVVTNDNGENGASMGVVSS